jgi:hypothetical protein
MSTLSLIPVAKYGVNSSNKSKAATKKTFRAPRTAGLPYFLNRQFGQLTDCRIVHFGSIVVKVYLELDRDPVLRSLPLL